MKISAEDQSQLEALGISREEIQRQEECLRRGPAYLSILGPCEVGKGILRLEDSEQRALRKKYLEARSKFKLAKFVPASGAATRMFKDLVAQLHHPDTFPQNSPTEKFFQELTRFPFWPALKKHGASRNQDPIDLLKLLLEPGGLDLANRPKGLVEFHRYGEECRTAFIEHFFEARAYFDTARSYGMHFTLPLGAQEAFEKNWFNYAPGFPHAELEFSLQNTNTRTISLDESGQVNRKKSGEIHFRPGGHGALLSNLNSLNHDIIFIKNIDNVARQEFHERVGLWQEILAGLLLQSQESCFVWVKKIKAKQVQAEELPVLEEFLRDTLGLELSGETSRVDFSAKLETYHSLLNRPLRVCGMVPNQGEPGGGPFWVRDGNGKVSKQIVEQAQINPEDNRQRDLFARSTHFNPVQLVCGLKDFQGKVFDLRKYSDPESYFTAKKSMEGKAIQVLEWPGLWNGAMAHWNTIFVEVPIETFCPVKTVLDLLKPQHLGEAV